MKWLSIASLAATGLIGYGCGTSASVPSQVGQLINPSPPPSINPSPPPFRAYVSSGSGNIYAYNLPLTASSTPVVTFADTGAQALAMDPSGRLFVANGGVDVYNQPVTNNALPAFTLSANPPAQSPSFDNAGDLFVNQGTGFRSGHLVGKAPAPVISGSSLALCFGTGLAARDIAIDGSGNLWQNLTVEVAEHTPPICSKTRWEVEITHHTAGAGGLDFDSQGDMFVSGQNGIDVYIPPLRDSSTIAYTIVTTSFANYFAFGAGGDLFVTVEGGDVLMFEPPFSAASQPAVTLALPTGSGPAIGVAIGR